MTETTTIRLTLSAKHALDRIRTAMQRSSPHKVTQQEAAERAFAMAAEHSELLQTDNWKPTKAQIKFMDSLIGVVSDPSLNSDEVDDVLYGKRE